MNTNSSIIKELDNIVSRLVKLRDVFCVARLKNCRGLSNDPMHVAGRVNMLTRWDLQAVYGGCRVCHSYLDTHPKEKEKFFRQFLGDELFDRIEQDSRKNCKYLPLELREIKKRLKNEHTLYKNA